MSGYSALPPIGTELNPFVGNFNGQGYKISNLTVSNKFSDYTLHPAAISAFDNSTKKQPHILGLFGVIGTYTGGNVQNAYSSAANELVDTGISNITVKSVVSDSLMGLAAGYVNADISSVAVSSGTLTMPDASGNTSYPMSNGHGQHTDNISDHGLVGYTVNKTTIQKVTDTLYDLTVQTGQEYTANRQGATAGWGGSIDMNSVFNRIKNLRPTATTTDGFYETHKHLNDGADANPVVHTNQYVYRFLGNGTDDYRGVINYSYQETRKYYLLGGKYQDDYYYKSYNSLTEYHFTDNNGNYLIYNGTAIANSNDANSHPWEFQTINGTGYIRTNRSGTYYYLMYNNGNLAIQNVNQNQATNWTISSDNFDLSIRYTQGGNNYYVRYSGSSWGLTNASNYSTITDTSGAYFIPTSIIRNTSTSALTASATEVIRFNTVANGTQVSFSYDGTTYYLCVYYRNQRTPYITTRTVAGNSAADYLYALNYYNGGYIRTADRYGNNYYYLRYNNGWTYGTNNNNSYYPLTVTTHSHVANALLQSDKTTHGMKFTANDTTYFPINVYTENGYDSENQISYKTNDAMITNTGYFVGGSTNNTWGATSINSTTPPRNLIFANYPKASVLTKGFSSSTNKFDDANVYTIDDAATPVHALNYSDTEKYSKYASSKSTLEGVLSSGGSDVGGFHFYAANPDYGISKNHIVNAKNVRINTGKQDAQGKPIHTYANYELPVYSVDFYLKEQGRINFFAGMYNGGYGGSSAGTTGADHMNGFFSLHKVYRDSNDKITNIREIKAIYKDTTGGEYDHYIYSYKDGNNIVNETGGAFSAGANYEKLFDTDWIGHRRLDGQQGRIFYFEIPIDEGEYCLGGYKTPDGISMDGAYMIYLDIGAGAAKMQRTMIAEHYLSDTYTYIYPAGVALIPTNTAGTNDFEANNSVCFVVQASYRGEVSVSRDNANHVTLERAADYRDISKPNYVSDVIVSVVDPGITSGSNDITSTTLYVSKVSKETYRVQYYDYNLKFETLTKTIIEDVRTKSADGNWTAFTRGVTQQVDDGDILILTSQSQIDSGDILVFKYLGLANGDTGKAWNYTELMNTSSTIYFNGTSAITASAICSTLTDKILELYHLVDGNVTLDLAIILEMVENDSTENLIFYDFEDYLISPTVTGGSVTFVVIYRNGEPTIYFIDHNTELTEVDQKIVAPRP